jgi:hypothetical protein
MNKEQAKLLLPLVNHREAWVGLEEYLQELTQLMQQQLVAELSELEVRRFQGKLALLQILVKLKKSVNDTIEVEKNGRSDIRKSDD